MGAAPGCQALEQCSPQGVAGCAADACRGPGSRSRAARSPPCSGLRPRTAPGTSSHERLHLTQRAPSDDASEGTGGTSSELAAPGASTITPVVADRSVAPAAPEHDGGGAARCQPDPGVYSAEDSKVGGAIDRDASVESLVPIGAAGDSPSVRQRSDLMATADGSAVAPAEADEPADVGPLHGVDGSPAAVLTSTDAAELHSTSEVFVPDAQANSERTDSIVAAWRDFEATGIDAFGDDAQPQPKMPAKAQLAQLCKPIVSIDDSGHAAVVGGWSPGSPFGAVAAAARHLDGVIQSYFQSYDTTVQHADAVAAGVRHGRFDLESASALYDDVVVASVVGVDQEQLMCQSFPFFVVFVTLASFSLWLYYAAQSGFEGTFGLDSLWPKQTRLQMYDDCADQRLQLWRWLSYQFTHVSLYHVSFNSAGMLFVGSPFETFHGHWRAALIYSAGVVGGAWCHMVLDAHTALIGISAGVYALTAAYLSDLALNWYSIKYRKPRIVILVAGLALDSGFTAAGITNGNDEGAITSHPSHLGGFVAGLIMGVLFGRNLRVQRCERALQLLAFGALLAGGIAFAMWLTQWPPKSSGEEEGWCWVRAVTNYSIFNDSAWHCVRCGSSDCIDAWSQQRFLSNVDHRSCDSKYGWASPGR